MGKFRDFLKAEQQVKKPRTEAEQALWDMGFRCREGNSAWARTLCMQDSPCVLYIRLDLESRVMSAQKWETGGGDAGSITCCIPAGAVQGEGADAFLDWIDGTLGDWLENWL